MWMDQSSRNIYQLDITNPRLSYFVFWSTFGAVACDEFWESTQRWHIQNEYLFVYVVRCLYLSLPFCVFFLLFNFALCENSDQILKSVLRILATWRSSVRYLSWCWKTWQKLYIQLFSNCVRRWFNESLFNLASWCFRSNIEMIQCVIMEIKKKSFLLNACSTTSWQKTTAKCYFPLA